MKLSIELEEQEIIDAVMTYLTSKGYQANKENIDVDSSVC